MTGTALLDALPLITSPLALVAFLAAAVVIAQAQALGRAESLIKTAPEADRKTLVSGALQILDLKVQDLTRQQRLELALEQIRHRRMKSWMSFAASLLIGILFAGVAAYSFYQQQVDPAKAVSTLLSGPERSTVIAELRTRGIFDASERDIVDYLVSRTAIPPDRQASASEGELLRLAYERYEAVASVKELRRRAEDRAEPFRPLGELVTVTVPGDRDDQPRQFFAHVPINSRYKWKTIRITNPSTNEQIRVLARPAIDESSAGTGLHLNREQAALLNGGPQTPAKIEMVVRETSEPISDANCSRTGRSKKFRKIADELCEQGKSVEVAYLLNTMGR